MLKRALVAMLRALGVLPRPEPTGWERYRDYLCIHPTAIIAPSATVKIFNPPTPPRICLEIGEGSHVFSSFSLLRPEATIRVGRRSQLGNSTFICADSIEVGDDVLMAWGVTVMDNDAHALCWEGRRDDVRACYDDYLADPGNLIRHKDWSGVACSPIVVGSRSWIGFNASILKGVTVGEESVVGAGSVLVRDVPARCVAAGNPARVVKSLHEGDGP